MVSWYVFITAAQESMLRTCLEDGRHGYNMKCISVTSDDNGHIFVCDTNHQCVRVFSTDGEFISCLVKKREHELSDSLEVRWCKNIPSVIFTMVVMSVF